MKNVAIIIPYFGKLPQNMESFLMTCRYNPKIDWFIFTDQQFNNYPQLKNVHFIKSTFDNVKSRIQRAVGKKKIVLDSPYKLCDYRPLYGLAFRDILGNYIYWGYSDLDVVYGDLWHFIQLPIQKRIDKIGIYGHFTLFRNDPKVNSRYKLDTISSREKVDLFWKAASTAKAEHFDEADGINQIYKYYDFSTYNNQDLVNEPYPENMDLISMDRRYFRLADAYTWKNGKCYFLYKKDRQIKCKEFGYFHFQKRRFNSYLSSTDVSRFYVNSSGYHVIDSETEKDIIMANHHAFFKRFSYLTDSLFRTPYFTSRHIGKLRLPVMHILIRMFVTKDFFI